MKSNKVYFLILVMMGLFGLFQNCSPVSFSANSSVAGVSAAGDDGDYVDGYIPGSNCHSVFDSVQTPIELIFVVDASSSNNSTDPDQSVRAGSIQKFYDAYKAKSNFKWDVISFAGSSATIRAQASGANSVEDFITWLYAYPHDIKGTPYDAALSKTKDVIAGDSSPSANKKYVIVFLSDGRPSGSDSDSYWSSEVAKVAALFPGRVSFNTIYYGGDNADASGLLRSMATAGHGNFLDTNRNPNGKAFDIADLAVVPGEVCD
jgi:Mg-chelatase subunit ChlD